MNFYIYDQDLKTARRPSKTFLFNPDNYDPHEMYEKHYSNLLELQFFAKHEKDARARCRLEKEMEIARRKLKYWSNTKNFDFNFIAENLNAIKAMWAGKL